MTTPTAFDPRTAGWSWAELGITEAQAQRIPVSAEVEAYSAKKAASALRGLVANPGVTALQRVAAELVAMGVTVRYVDGWGSRGYLPLTLRGGLMNHWIVSTYRPGLVAPTLGLIVNGHSTLAGPLANLVLGFDGTVYIVAALSANHGGVGSWRGISGNDRWLGIECEGGPILQPAALAALAKVNAAVARALGKDPAEWCIGHHEYAPKRKVDIGTYMPDVRAAAVRIYRGGPPAPTPTPPEEDTLMMSRLMRAKGDSRTYLVQGLTRRHVPNPQRLADLQYLNREAQFLNDAKGEVREVSPEFLAMFEDVT